MPKILLQLLEASWNDVTKAAVINCFLENQNNAVAVNHDFFKGLQEDLSKPLQYNPELLSEELTAKDVVNTDLNVTTRNAPTSDIEILESANLEEENKIDKVPFEFLRTSSA